MIEALPLVGYCCLLAAAATTDLLRYRIPNVLVGAMALLYPAHLLVRPDRLDLSAFAAAGAVLAVGFVLFAWGRIGGGDAKLLAVAALWAGAADLPLLLAVMALTGGAMSVLVVGRSRFLLARAAGAVGSVRLRDGLIARELPYGVAIAAGGLASAIPALAG
ncbi:prepilin peptidase [Arenibaculum sp.]|jgi:prepilin peptidase CpaA|uniref:prepilin peptidase n=1 Tax=Arenibaculum sp. TaxID=2865862 RepID=UPI002E0E753F|nr:prepilin peptidase [Arenibaculum sp.]